MASDYLPQAHRHPITDDYTVSTTLGSGTFSVVKLGVHKKSGDRKALKIISKEAVGEKTQMLLTEVEILHAVRHRHIIGLDDIYETDDKVILVMELVTGGELFDKIVEKGNYTEQDASVLVRQIAEATLYLHERGIVHRDLKPENLLYASDEPGADIKIADFGLSKIVGSDAVLMTACGTPGYVAPEVLENEGYSKAVDMWSIGVIMYILLCGFPPFYSEKTAELFEIIMEGDYDYPSPYWDDVSDSAKDLINNLLTVDPAKRYTAEQVLSHPWIGGAAAPDTDMMAALDEMKKYNARRKFKMAILSTVAANRISKMGGGS